MAGEFNEGEPEPSAIDPAVFVDDDGRTWLVYGGGHIWSVEVGSETGLPLGEDVWEPDDPYQHHLANGPLVDEDGSPLEEDDAAWIEAPFLAEHDGWYYLFVNWYACCRGLDSTYEIRVGRSDSPTGPFVDRDGFDLRDAGGTLVLDGDEERAGPCRTVRPR